MSREFGKLQYRRIEAVNLRTRAKHAYYAQDIPAAVVETNYTITRD